VPALAVGVVDHGVEHRDPTQRGVVAPAHQRDDIGMRILRDPQLNHARPQRGVLPVNSRRHDSPAGRLGHLVRGDLTLGERAVRKVPQRPLTGHRLVHGCGGDALRGDGAVQRRVRRVDEPALDRYLPRAQQREGLVGRQFERLRELVGHHGPRMVPRW
jgi:hypothetical protein